MDQALTENLQLPEREAEVKESGRTVDAFLQMLRSRIEAKLLDEISDPKKVTLGDYLKLIAVIEERNRTLEPEHKEIVVRWEDLFEKGDVCS